MGDTGIRLPPAPLRRCMVADPSGGNGHGPPRPTIVITLGPHGPEVSAPSDIILALGMLEVAKTLIGQRLHANSEAPSKIIRVGPMPDLKG